MRITPVAVALLFAAAPAFAAPDPRCTALVANFSQGAPVTTSASGLRYRIVKEGGKKLVRGNVAISSYLGCFANGDFLDATGEGHTFSFTYGMKQVIAGAEEGFALFGEGGEILIYIPAVLAYGPNGRPPVVPANSDLVFDYQLTGIADTALSTVLQAAYDSGGVAKMKAAYRTAAGGGFKNIYATEDDANNLGYHFLKEKHPDAAVAILTLNAERFPNSWNAYDSLGDALREAEQTDGAIKNYKRALELNPKDDNASTFLKILEAATK